jgi:hypothetical protein
VVDERTRTPNLLEITTAWLKENGYDGLFNQAGMCGCKLDDLFPCSETDLNCQAGYLVEPSFDEELTFVISEVKPDGL